MISSIHIGDLIKQELVKQERSISWLAKKVNCNRSNFSRVLKHKDINSDLLWHISYELGINFFELFYKEMENRLFEKAL